MSKAALFPSIPRLGANSPRDELTPFVFDKSRPTTETSETGFDSELRPLTGPGPLWPKKYVKKVSRAEWGEVPNWGPADSPALDEVCLREWECERR